MRSLTAALASSFVLCSIFSFAQYNTQKYIKRNRHAPITTYGDSAMYSRGVYNDSNVLYFGNSNGAMLWYNTESTEKKLLLKYPSFTEIRDVERSGKYLYGMHSGDDGKLVRMTERGPVGFVQTKDWIGVFFDALDFNGNTGFIMGDPVNGKFSLFHSKDGGMTWNRCEGSVDAYKGEAGFAASGSNAHVLNDSTYIFVSGGAKTRFFKTTDSGKTWSNVVIPYYPGESIGAYSMCFSDENNGVVVGGDYTQPGIRMNTTYYTTDGGATWMNAMNPPRGYRSCVYYANGIYYACGTNGIDFSTNGGKDWTPFADGSYFAMTHFEDQLIATMRFGKYKTFKLLEKK